MILTTRLSIFAMLVVFSVALPKVHAELIQLDSGETIQGEVLKITRTHLQLRHEIFGEIEIPRDRVHSIILGDPKTGKIIKPDGSDAKPETPAEVIDRLANKDFGPQAIERLEKGAKRQPIPEDAVEQLRREGVDPQLTDRLHLMLPGFGTPEVQSYFNGRVQGLMNGSITLQNIRDDAINARNQLHEIMEDLGPDAAALQGYYSILDNFIEKTAPPDPRPKPQYPSPAPDPKH